MHQMNASNTCTFSFFSTPYKSVQQFTILTFTSMIFSGVFGEEPVMKKKSTSRTSSLPGVAEGAKRDKLATGTSTLNKSGAADVRTSSQESKRNKNADTLSSAKKPKLSTSATSPHPVQPATSSPSKDPMSKKKITSVTNLQTNQTLSSKRPPTSKPLSQGLVKKTGSKDSTPHLSKSPKRTCRTSLPSSLSQTAPASSQGSMASGSKRKNFSNLRRSWHGMPVAGTRGGQADGKSLKAKLGQSKGNCHTNLSLFTQMIPFLPKRLKGNCHELRMFLSKFVCGNMPGFLATFRSQNLLFCLELSISPPKACHIRRFCLASMQP